jgi:hypothetical protein
MRKVFAELQDYAVRKRDSKFKKGMAFLHYNSQLQKTAFTQFTQAVRAQIDEQEYERATLSRCHKVFNRLKKVRCLRAIQRHALK